MDIKSPSSTGRDRAETGMSAAMDCVIVTSAADMASVLLLAHPNGAFDFARAMHERACYGHDHERVDFWLAAMHAIAKKPDTERRQLRVG